MNQLKLNLNRGRHGGRRSNSGRTRKHSKGVAHRLREKVSTRTPLHVNFKYRTQVRNKDTLKILKKAILNSRRQGLRVIHFSFQTNHVHLIIEADTNKLLTKGMRSLTVTMAKGLQKGKVQLERYHLHVLKTLRETKNAIEYVCFNQHKHERGTCTTLNDYSSFPSLKWVKDYARNHRVMLIFKVKERWESDDPHSFLLNQAIIAG